MKKKHHSSEPGERKRGRKKRTLIISSEAIFIPRYIYTYSNVKCFYSSVYYSKNAYTARTKKGFGENRLIQLCAFYMRSHCRNQLILMIVVSFGNFHTVTQSHLQAQLQQ